jgi:hypothetical protein
MWFFFGFITLTTFIAYFWYKRIKAGWRGTSQRTGAFSYQYKVVKNDKTVNELLIGIDAAPGYDYFLKNENALDRFFKRIGFSVEHQTGNKAFDDKVYIVSDNRQFQKQLTADGEIVDALLKVFNFGRTYQCRVQEVRHSSGRLWIKYSTGNGFNERRITALASRVVPVLYSINKTLKHIPLTASGSWKDPFVIKATFLLAVSSALAVNGALQVYRFLYTTLPVAMDTDKLLQDALLLGGGIITLLLTLSFWTLGRSARAHLVLIELLIVGSFGAVLTAYEQLNDLNMELDRSQGRAYETTLLKKHVVRTRRSTNYYAHMNDWHHTAAGIEIKITGNLYNALAPGDRLVVTEKPGYYDYRWIETIKKK